MSNSYLDELIELLIKTAICGVTKDQIARMYKDTYSLSDKEMENLIEMCKFRTAPKKIDYSYFYNNPITKKGEKINFPFTQLYIYKNFLTKTECERLMGHIDKGIRPSTIANDTDIISTSDYRTSQTSDLHYYKELDVVELDIKLENLMELDPFIGEALQAQKYNPGQYYKEHWDFFPPKDKKQYQVYCGWMGQRTWTTMIYLNDVEEGGETYFKRLNLKLKPRQGTLIAWNNLRRNGKPNYKTMHEAIPPVKGDKYVITKWWRSWSLI